MAAPRPALGAWKYRSSVLRQLTVSDWTTGSGAVNPTAEISNNNLDAICNAFLIAVELGAGPREAGTLRIFDSQSDTAYVIDTATNIAIGTR
jgi:hypothetical protein